MTEKDSFTLKRALAAGVLAAALAALLWFSLFNVPFLPILFGIGVTLPILYVLFADGLGRAALAALCAALLLCCILPLTAAALFAFFFFPPALFVGWLLGLKTAPQRSAVAAQQQVKNIAGSGKTISARHDGGNTAAQAYPLSSALFQLALTVAFVTIAVLSYGFSQTDSTQAFHQLTEQIMQLMQQNNLYQIPLQNGDMRVLLQRLLPILCAVSLALYGFLFQLAALYCAMRLAKQRGVLKRPFGYWPGDLRMPSAALLLFVGLWIVSFFADSPKHGNVSTLALCLNVILSVLAVGFCVSGLAVLHQVARGGWLWLRIIVYICLFSLVLTPIIFFGLVIMGLFATVFPSKNQGGKPPASIS